MSKDPFNLEMTIPDLINYIKKCPKIYVHELPDKLEKYINAKIDIRERIDRPEEVKKTMEPVFPIHLIETTQRRIFRTEMALKILGNQNIHITTTPEHLANYVVELTDALMDELDKTP